jgi:hypothetical protein
MITIDSADGSKITVANDGGYPCIAIYGPKGGRKGYIDFPLEDALRIAKELMKVESGQEPELGWF